MMQIAIPPAAATDKPAGCPGSLEGFRAASPSHAVEPMEFLWVSWFPRVFSGIYIKGPGSFLESFLKEIYPLLQFSTLENGKDKKEEQQ